ncbi:MAG: hypothetical protein V4787_17040 [Pseudomonadota bacterium]
MHKTLCAAAVAVLLAACGGGGPAQPVDIPAAESGRKAPANSEPTLAAEPASLVNTATSGDQSLRAASALDDGGWAVSWLSTDNAIHVQRYDAAGAKAGSETVMQPVVVPGSTVVSNSAAAAVLAGGDVVVAYIRRGDIQPDATTASGVYAQRFDAGGLPAGPEIALATRTQREGSRTPYFSNVQLAPLSDGGFVAGWADMSVSPALAPSNRVYVARFDAQGQVASPSTQAGTTANWYAVTADAEAGYTVTLFPVDAQFTPQIAAVHYDAGNTAANVVSVQPGTALVLLPLAGGGYVAYAQDGGGAYRQMLDAQGQPASPREAVASMPFAAIELAGGQYAVFWQDANGVTAQEYSAGGAPVGNAVQTAAKDATTRAAALAEGGAVLAWSAVGASGDMDVFAQRLTEVLTPGEQARRKTCREQSKQLPGKDRRAFVIACLK